MNDKEIKEILDNALEYLEGIDETRNTKILTTNEANILLNYITNLQSNWNSLRECIETDNKRAKGYIERIRTSDLCHGDYPVEYYYAEKRKEITDYYLDKMNELEGKDKE